MTYELKEGEGSLWRNAEKQTEKHPDYKGSQKIGGREYWLNAWLNETKDGKKYLSIKAKPKDERQPPKGAAVPAPRARNMDSEIPF